MKKDKITIEHMKDIFSNIPYGKEFTRKEIRKMITDKFGNMEVIPSDFCYNRYNENVNLEKTFESTDVYSNMCHGTDTSILESDNYIPEISIINPQGVQNM